jgi:orotidine-5'-phosphate decarboxylase
MEALKRTCAWLHAHYPEIPILLDAKRGDMENTNEAYARAIFDYYEADAVTVHPYLGAKALAPFLDRPAKTSFVLCRTSNPDSAELQELEVAGGPLYLKIARLAAGPEWNRHGNVGLVTGATYPTDLGRIRAVAPNLPLLVPGIGAQGGELEPVLNYGLDATGEGIIISASRSIIYASSGPDFAEAARREAAHLAQAMQQGQQEVMEKRRKF